MALQVQSLKVLATRQVVLQRMDYSTYLTGNTKDELDRLNNLEGDYKIYSSKLTIEAFHDGKRLPSDDWETFKQCWGERTPNVFARFIENETDFFIFEHVDGPRAWHGVFEKINWAKGFFKESGALKQSPQTGYWNYFDDFLEDGKLVSVIKRYDMNDGKMENVFDYRNSLTPDKQGNVIWEFIWSAPKQDMRITKVIWATKCGNLFSKC